MKNIKVMGIMSTPNYTTLASIFESTEYFHFFTVSNDAGQEFIEGQETGFLIKEMVDIIKPTAKIVLVDDNGTEIEIITPDTNQPVLADISWQK